MERKSRTALCVVAALALAACAPAGQPNPGLLNQQQQARQLAEELLKDKRVAVRVYKDFKANPAAYEIFHIPTTGLTLSCDAANAASRGLSENSVLLVLPTDQPDPIVRQVLEGYISCMVYRPGATVPLWPWQLSDIEIMWWTFLDALGSPIANAQVEIELIPLYMRASSDPVGRIPLGKQKTDDQGRLDRLRLASTNSKFLFTISHPAYGTIRTESVWPKREDPSPHTYTLPVARPDADVAARSIRGIVLDSDGNSVPGAEVSLSGSGPLPPASVLTDPNGRFALCLPTIPERASPPDLGPLFMLYVEPPERTNLARQRVEPLAPGSNVTVALSRLSTEVVFHTCAFEYLNGPITSLDEIRKITLTLLRDNRESGTLRYDDFKNGCELPPGVLKATTTRWSQAYSFQEIPLTPTSPRDLIFKPQTPILYTGTVVYGDSNQPAAGIYVLANHHLAYEDPNSMTPEKLESLRTQALREKQNPPEEFLHGTSERVTVTDQNGHFELRFLPGFSPSLGSISAYAPGYVSTPIAVPGQRPRPDGILQIPLPIELALPKPLYHPQFIFEDESGPVTDPNLLSNIAISIRSSETGGSGFPFRTMAQHRFSPGIYTATGVWNGKQYSFGPVDLTTDRPPVIVLKPTEIKKNSLIFRGQVIHGITRQPMPGAIVYYSARRGPVMGGLNPAMLTAEQWKAIHEIGPDFNPDHPALTPFAANSIARTDASGRFEVALPSTLSIGPMESLIALEQDFIPAGQYLELTPRPGSDTIPYSSLLPDKDGFINLVPMRLFPAGRVIIHPVVPDYGQGGPPPRLSAGLFTLPDDPTPWLKDFWGTPKDNQGSHTQRGMNVQTNQKSTCFVPAGVDLVIQMYLIGESEFAPTALGPFKLQPGQVLDLGKSEFPHSVQVKVKVVGPDGRLVPNLYVGYRRADGVNGYSYPSPRTATDGTAMLNLPPNSTGTIHAVYYSSTTKDRLEEGGIPYQIAGQEDKDKEFTLQLSEEFVKKLPR